MKNDLIGRAIADYFEHGETPDIEIQTNYTEGELLSPAYFFRTVNEMPEIEKTALNLCRGKVLDVGAAAGCHAIVLQEKGLDVTALEKSELAASVMKKRGVENVICSNVFHFHEKGFQTILLLMNGTGIGGTLKGLKKLLLHLKNLLTPNGQIIIDSSDISYLFEEEDGSVWVDLTREGYFGEMNYELKYKNEFMKFNWLFTDFETLTQICKKIGLNSKKIMEGKNFDYLAQLTISEK
ncbi:SAM-dependent methyltransferase [Mariniphaga sp.]|uniref:SAM-dependent methyltransferase n=1 Tax=Mariniphaga sp. TaxID=1954475 RepID=UPI0035645D55